MDTYNLESTHNEICDEDVAAWAVRDLKLNIMLSADDLQRIFTSACRHAQARCAAAMHVRDAMTRDVLSVSKFDDISHAVKLLAEKNISGLPVVDRENRVVGIISEADVVSMVGSRRAHTFKELDLNPPQTHTGSNWVTFGGTVVATGTNMTLWLDGQTIGTGQNKAECFDSVTITCIGATAPPVLEYKRQGNDLVFSWPTNYGNYGLVAATNLGSGATWSAVPPPPTVVNGTNVVANTISGERRFYRLMQP